MSTDTITVPRDVVAKAIDALYRYCRNRGHVFDQPVSHVEGTQLENGRVRFDLTSVRGVLASFEWTGKRVVRVEP